MLGSVKRRAVIQEITRRLLNADSAKLVTSSLRLELQPSRLRGLHEYVSSIYTCTGWVTSTRNKPVDAGNQMHASTCIPIQALAINAGAF